MLFFIQERLCKLAEQYIILVSSHAESLLGPDEIFNNI